MNRTRALRLRGLVAAAIAVPTALAPTAGASAAIQQDRVVQEDPANYTPNVPEGLGGTDGTVTKFAQIGNVIYAVGQIGVVENAARTKTYARSNFVAFNATTGEVLPLAPRFNGRVNVVVPTADGKGLYIGGDFTTVDGVKRAGLVRYDLVNARVDTRFQPFGRLVDDAQLVGNRLFVASATTGKQLVALDPLTGADTGYVKLQISGVTDSRSATKVARFAVDPQGTRLVAIGNFSSVNGVARRQVFMAVLGQSGAALGSWYSAKFDRLCSSNIPFWARNVDFSPDGSYFVIVASGGIGSPPGTICDSASRWEKSNSSSTANPTWVNYTGGDSLYSVAVTGPAVYVGGHMRWLDNPEGRGYAGPGAVSRNGVGAINPATGKALAWNPGKTRGHGTEELYATSSGLWVGSDGRYFNGEYREAIAFCPL